jgi:hypothetical protein
VQAAEGKVEAKGEMRFFLNESWVYEGEGESHLRLKGWEGGGGEGRIGGRTLRRLRRVV